jgi:tRNA 2-thiouridine synthesizing protein E
MRLLNSSSFAPWRTVFARSRQKDADLTPLATAKTVTFRGKHTYSLDGKGFLSPSEQWDEAFAEGMARQQDIHGGLTDQHWSFIRYLRTKFLDEQTVPLLVHACADNKMRLGRLKSLFPTGYHRGACRIAGINYEFMVADNIWHTYETKPVQPPKYQTTALGFLRDFDDWDEPFAHAIADAWDLPDGLTDQHLAVVHFLRDYYGDNGASPTVYQTCERATLELEELHALFPDGYHRGACRMAGLPFLS